MKTDPIAQALDNMTKDINDHIMATLIAVILVLAFALVWLGYTSNRKIKDLQWALRESGRKPHVHYASHGKDRWKERSPTLVGIAQAMAEQWGK